MVVNASPGRRVTVIVPVYNSEHTLAPLVTRLGAVLLSVSSEHEIVMVNDGSRDRSWDVISDLASRNPHVRGVNLSRNYGQHNALVCGIRLARFETIITIDDDLQHPPEEIPKLLAKLDEGFDVVYGTPDEEQHGFWRDLASRVTKLALQKAMGIDVAGSVSAFRAIRLADAATFVNYQGPYVSVDVLLTWGTTRFDAVTVRHEWRTVGASNYTFRKLLTHAINMLTGFSTWPLQVASITGFAFTLFGIGVLMYVVGRYLLQGVKVPGFAFLASSIAVFSGAQLFTLGIVGEYLARMHFRVIGKPLYIVRDVVNLDSQSPARSSTR